MTTELIRYDAMCRAIDQAYEVDEVKDIRDKAMAIEVYSRQALNTEAERKACDIRLRAERKAGEILKKMEKAKGGGDFRAPKEHRSTQDTGARTLEALGISKAQSSKWQQLADVPAKQFDAALATPEKPTTSGILRASQEPRRAPMDPHALWLWGRLRDIERDGFLDEHPQHLLNEMTDAMRADALRLIPLVCDWLGGAGIAPQSRTLLKRTASEASGTPDGNADGNPEAAPSGSQATEKNKISNAAPLRDARQEGFSEPGPSGSEYMDTKRWLYTSGLSWLEQQTSKPCRSVLGKFIDEAGGNMQIVRATIEAAQNDPPVNPIPWIRQGIQIRQ